MICVGWVHLGAEVDRDLCQRLFPDHNPQHHQLQHQLLQERLLRVYRRHQPHVNARAYCLDCAGLRHRYLQTFFHHEYCNPWWFDSTTWHHFRWMTVYQTPPTWRWSTSGCSSTSSSPSSSSSSTHTWRPSGHPSSWREVLLSNFLQRYREPFKKLLNGFFPQK